MNKRKLFSYLLIALSLPYFSSCEDEKDEETIQLSLKSGGLLLKGQGLHIQKLDLQEGKAVVTGILTQASYTEKREKTEGGFFGKMLK